MKPNEISLERPYIDTHIKATRSAYELEQRVKVVTEFKTKQINVHRYRRYTSRFWITCGFGIGGLFMTR